jgi:hypothetical protein
LIFARSSPALSTNWRIQTTSFGGPEHQIALCKEPVDVLLESKSGTHPTRHVQVVTIPSNDHLEMRDDNSNIPKFENRLKSILTERKMAGFEVQINLTAEAVLHGIPAQIVSQIADLIQRIQCEGLWVYMTLGYRNTRRMSRGTYRMCRGYRFLQHHYMWQRGEGALFLSTQA